MTSEQMKAFSNKYGRTILDHSCIDKVTKMDRSTLSSKEQLHLDVFLLSYYTGGSTVRELASLNWGDIREGYIYCKRSITGNIAKIPYSECVACIIEKYSDQCINDYLLPIFTQKHVTEEQMDGRVKRFSELLNITLKKVIPNLDITSDITINSTHRIYIELMLWRGESFEKIAERIGCSYLTIIRHHEEMIEIRDELEKEGLI